MTGHKKARLDMNWDKDKAPANKNALALRKAMHIYEIVLPHTEKHQFFLDGQLRLGLFTLQGTPSFHYTFTFGQDPSKRSIKSMV